MVFDGACCRCFEALHRRAPQHDVEMGMGVPVDLALRCSAQRSLEGCATGEVLPC